MIVNQEKINQELKALVNRRVSLGAASYNRQINLPKLFGPACLKWTTQEVIAHLENAVRAGKRAAISGRWFYDANRQLALRQALHAELGYRRSI